MSKSIYTTLSDDDLIDRCDQLINDFCHNRMQEWVMHIPAQPNKDPDLVFSELIMRFKKLLEKENSTCKWVRDGKQKTFYNTGCDKTYITALRTVSDFTHCPYCGKKIEVKNEN